ncbi:hypothetical protein WA026_001492 [Henosepilachna vigintioctopunctata]|uniref:tRNA-splicing endonuclease subunit Sen2 n=1 Tax=Henosepilachna vigintioctopunctata TaxID=420089 RepID=A0AAW1US49_9CUCU
MDITPPRPKKKCRLPKPTPLPLIPLKNGGFYRFQGIFNGFSVCIKNIDEMKKCVSMGFFGKANLSRSYPQFDGNIEKPELIRKRQWHTRERWHKKCNVNNSKKVIVLPDSDDEDGEYFKHLQAEYKIDRCGNLETVNLMLEEAFFLQNVLNCLDIFHETRLLNNLETLQLFSNSDDCFQHKYVTYYHFRSKNWVVKPGIKFGGDFLLYKEGPPFHHASYVVLIQEENKEIDTTSLMGLHRMCETAGKELLICQIFWPSEVTLLGDLSNIKVNEILMKRWVSSQERQEVI